MNIDWEGRRTIEERGTVTRQELCDLIEDADYGDVAIGLLDALKEALFSVGFHVIDVSTDDGTEWILTKVDPDVEDPSVLIS